MTSWFYSPNGSEQRGPVEEAELLRMLSGGELAWTSLVWSAGMPDWAPAQAVLVPAPQPVHSIEQPAPGRGALPPAPRRSGHWAKAAVCLGLACLAVEGASAHIGTQLGTWANPMLHFATAAACAVISVCGLALAAAYLLRASSDGSRGAGLVFLLAAVFVTLMSTAFGIPLYRVDKSMTRMHYDLSIQDEGHTLLLRGTFASGITPAIRSRVSGLDIRTVRLESPGGLVAPSQELGKLIQENGWKTDAAADCSSACLIPFFSGKGPIASIHSRFGFHTPRISAEVSDFFKLAESKMAEQYFSRLRKLGVPEKYIDAARTKHGADAVMVDSVALLKDGVIAAVYDDSGRSLTIPEAEWAYFANAVAPDAKAKPAKGDDAMSTILAAIAATRGDIVEANAGPLYEATAKQDAKALRIAVKTFTTQVVAKAMPAASDDALRQYLATFTDIGRRLMLGGKDELCAQLAYDGAMSGTLPPADGNALFDKAADVIGSAAANAWKHRSPNPDSAHRINALAAQAFSQPPALDPARLKTDRHIQCLWSVRLFSSITAESPAVSASDYRYMLQSK